MVAAGKRYDTFISLMWISDVYAKSMSMESVHGDMPYKRKSGWQLLINRSNEPEKSFLKASVMGTW